MRIHLRDVATVADLRWLLGELRTRATVAVDVETACDTRTKGSRVPLPWDAGARVVSASFTWDEGQAAVLALSHPGADRPWREQWAGVLGRCMQALSEPRPHRGGAATGPAQVVAHNARYDLTFTAWATGIDSSDHLWWDTMIGASLLDENASKSLKELGIALLGLPDSWAIDLAKPEAVPWPTLCRYNAVDTVVTWELLRAQFGLLHPQEPLGVLMHHLLMPTQREYLRIERRGVPFDAGWAQARLQESEAGLDRIVTELQSPAHTPPDLLDKHGWTTHKVPRPKPVSWAPTSKFFIEWMDRKAAPVLKVTPAGRPSWDESVLKAILSLEEHRPWAELLLQHRGLRKDVDAFLTPWLQISGRTPRGWLHPGYKLATVVTGRTASAHPNIQQVPKHLKPAFRAPRGWLFLQADYAQIELRVAAWLANERTMLAAFARGDDLHRLMAARIAGIPPEDVTPGQRQNAKAPNFGFLYGMGANKFADYALDEYGIDYSAAEARAVREAFFDQWPDLARWHERMRHQVYVDGEVRTPFGRRRRLPEARSRVDFARSGAERQAINAPVQSTGSDLLLLALGAIARAWRADGLQAAMLGSVHDSALAMVREDHLEQALSHLGPIMVKPDTSPFGFEVGVPLEVEVEIGPAWGESEDTRVFR